MRPLLVALALVLLAPGAFARRRAAHPPVPPAGTVEVRDDFRFGARGWEAGFADYSPVQAEIMELEADIRALPPEVGAGSAYFLQGHNRSDDLFMFLSKKIAVQPNQRYEVAFRIVFASQVGHDCGGIGGSPGASVYLKAGASGAPPLVVLEEDDHWRVTVDKGNQAEDGPAASNVSSIENGTNSCSEDAPFVSLERLHKHRHTVTSNAAGELWLIVGTDSGFEGRTQLYYQSIEATLTSLP